MRQARMYETPETMEQSPPVKREPWRPVSAITNHDLEAQIHNRAVELADLIDTVAEPNRSLVAHDAMHTLRESVTAQPTVTARAMPGRTSFGIFGAFLLIVGSATTVLYRGFGFVGAIFILVGIGIMVMGGLASLGRRKRLERARAMQIPPAARPPEAVLMAGQRRGVPLR